MLVIIPAHNEASLIAEALESLAAQTRIADEVIVIVDRCSDRTAQVVVAHGAAARLTILNRDNKGGALNQALAEVLPRLSDNDAVLMMDADTSLSPTFISEATWRLREPKGRRGQVGAVGGVFLGYPVHGFLGQLQNNEYVRYAREINRRKGRADVLTGTSTLFSARALRAVEHARSQGRLPPGTGVYDVDALTEDNELTLAIKHLGYRCVSPKACVVGTELMPTTARLFNQRLRWQRGALQNLFHYGITRQTVPYIGRQVMTYAAVAFLPFFLTTMAYTWTTTGSFAWSWFWIVVVGFVSFERVWSVKHGGWRSTLLAAAVFPEVVYDLFLHAVYIKALADLATHARGTWDNAEHSRSTGTQSRRRDNARAGLVYAGALAAIVGSAVACAELGVAWTMIAVLVLAGAAQAALRISGLDPFALVLGTGEPVTTHHLVETSNPHGFGGMDVPLEGLATPGGEGTHHWLDGGAVRNPGVTSSAVAQCSRQQTAAWLADNRRGASQSFKDTWGAPRSPDS